MFLEPSKIGSNGTFARLLNMFVKSTYLCPCRDFKSSESIFQSHCGLDKNSNKTVSLWLATQAREGIHIDNASKHTISVT